MSARGGHRAAALARPPVLALALALAVAPAPGAGAGPAPPRDADGFRLAVPPYAFAFPADHAAHPSYRSEWWYSTGHLAGRGRTYGYELTFFRVGMPRCGTAGGSAWAARDLVFVHLALTDESRGRYRCFDAVRRAVLGQAWADSTRFDVGLDGSYARLGPDGRAFELRGEAPEFAFALALAPLRPPAIHGERGTSQKTAGEGNASHYYSLTRLATRGRLAVAGDTLAVEGLSWMDHEFGTSRLGTVLAGWDWLSVQLDDGRDLMLYLLRHRDGRIEPLSSGTLVLPDGRTRHLGLVDFRIEATGRWTSPRSHARYPSGWRVRVPSEGLDLSLEPTVRDQELSAPSMGGVTYWEGSVRVSGGAGARAARGRGYVELTGYTGRAPF